jgi:hypothetical protein
MTPRVVGSVFAVFAVTCLLGAAAPASRPLTIELRGFGTSVGSTQGALPATTQLPGGSIRTRETQTFTFASPSRSQAPFRGRIVGGTGRYRGAAGTVSGGGPGHGRVAIWTETFRVGK